MADYPRTLEIEPIGDWPGEMSTRRIDGLFKVSPGQTVRELHEELRHLKGRSPKLLIAVTSDQIRRDGRLRAGEKPWHPGVILEFDTPDGPMRYPCDAYRKWEDNLRAIVKTLEALRAIARWKVATGQQYGGFLAIEAARTASGGVSSLEGALAIVGRIIGRRLTVDDVGDIRALVRAAQRTAHPDAGGDAGDFAQLEAAERFLRERGHL